MKYKDSVLGFAWSLARPMFLLAIYYVVFDKILKAGIPYFAFYLFAGLLAWDLFGSTLSSGTMSIVGNSGLIKKVYFPREILPLASVGAGLFNFSLQLLVLLASLLGFRYDFFGPNLLLLIPALITLVVFMTAWSLFLAAGNVYLRDVQHLLEVFLLFWFWLNPIVYPIQLVLAHKGKLLGLKITTLYFLNPMVDIVVCFQRAVYKHVYVKGVPTLYTASYGTYLARLSWVFLLSLGMLWLAQRLFARAQGNFAQEL